MVYFLETGIPRSRKRFNLKSRSCFSRRISASVLVGAGGFAGFGAVCNTGFVAAVVACVFDADGGAELLVCDGAAGAGAGVAGFPKSEDHSPLFLVDGDGALVEATEAVLPTVVFDCETEGAATVGVGNVAFVDTLMEGVNEKLLGLFSSFFPKISDKSVVSFKNDFIEDDVVVGSWLGF